MKELENRLIFVQWEEDSVAAASSHTIHTDSGTILPVQRLMVPDFLEVFEVLTTLRRSFSAKKLRQLKEQVYDLVLTDDPENKLVVADIDDDTDTEDIEVVFGAGVAAKLGDIGYSGGVRRWDLIMDVVCDSDKYQARPIVQKALPRILGLTGNVPVFKYLYEAGYLEKDGHIKNGADVPKVVSERARMNRGGIPVSRAVTKKPPRRYRGFWRHRFN